MADTLELFHGSHERLASIHDGGIFVGLFFGTRRGVALSHGSFLHRVELPREAIASSFDLGQADYEAVYAILRAESAVSDDLIEDLYDAVTDDVNPEESLWPSLRADDDGEAAWNAQALRGKVAAALGYSAIEMSDEHGTSYLVLPGTAIEFVGEL